MTYSLIRSLPLPADATKMILDYVGKTNTAKIIDKYFKYPLTRLNFSEWQFTEYIYNVVGYESKYFSDLGSYDPFLGRNILDLQSIHNIEEFDFDQIEIFSVQDWTNTIHRNYESYQQYCDRYGIFMSADLFWTGIGEFSYLDTTLFH